MILLTPVLLALGLVLLIYIVSWLVIKIAIIVEDWRIK